MLARRHVQISSSVSISLTILQTLSHTHTCVHTYTHVHTRTHMRTHTGGKQLESAAVGALAAGEQSRTNCSPLACCTAVAHVLCILCASVFSCSKDCSVFLTLIMAMVGIFFHSFISAVACHTFAVQMSPPLPQTTRQRQRQGEASRKRPRSPRRG